MLARYGFISILQIHDRYSHRRRLLLNISITIKWCFSFMYPYCTKNNHEKTSDYTFTYFVTEQINSDSVTECKFVNELPIISHNEKGEYNYDDTENCNDFGLTFKKKYIGDIHHAKNTKNRIFCKRISKITG